MIGKEILGYTIEEKIGSGGFGTVYKASKTDASGRFVRAIKHISIPTRQQYNDVLNSMGGDYSKVNNYFAEILKDIVGEIQILYDLTDRGVTNVVRYFDHKIVEQDNPVRYDIYISMEYLKPFDEYILQHRFAVRDVIKLGKDILRALTACHESGIMHRDIKEENIFVDANGSYKLGDFGVAKKLRERSRAASMKGTPNYIAPEVYLGRSDYDSTVDLYSLGIILYRLLNCGRNPFMPEYPAMYTSDDEDKAFDMRMKGEAPALPVNAKNKLGEIVVKAISKREQRYNSAKEFYSCLDELEQSLTNDDLNTVVMNSSAAVNEKPVQSKKEESVNNMQMNETVGTSNVFEEKEPEQDKKSNGHLFETEGGDYSSAGGGFVPPEPEQTNFTDDTYIPDIDSGPAYVPPVQKNMNWLIYAAPVIIAAVYVIVFVIHLHHEYDETVSFIDWAFKNPRELAAMLYSSSNVFPPVYKMVLYKILNYVFLGAFIASLYLVGRTLHFSKPDHAPNAVVVDKEAYMLALDAYETLKAANIPNSYDVMNAVKTVHDRLKNESDFGYGNQSVIQCEKDIAVSLKNIQSNIGRLQSKSTFEASKRAIISSCNRIMIDLKKRTEMKKR